MATVKPIDMSYKTQAGISSTQGLSPFTTSIKIVEREQQSEQRAARDQRRKSTASALGRRTSRESNKAATTTSRDRSAGSSRRSSSKSSITAANMASSPLDDGDVETTLKFPNFAQRDRQRRQDKCAIDINDERGRSPYQKPVVHYHALTVSSHEAALLDLDIFDFEQEDMATTSRSRAVRDFDDDDNDSISSSDSDTASVTSSTNTAVGAECPDCGKEAHKVKFSPESKTSTLLSRIVAERSYALPSLPTTKPRRSNINNRQRAGSDLDMIWDEEDEASGMQAKTSKPGNASQSSATTSRSSKPLNRLTRSATTVKRPSILPSIESQRRRVSEPVTTTTSSTSTASQDKESDRDETRPHDAAETLIRFAATRARLHRSGSLVSPQWDPRWSAMCSAGSTAQQKQKQSPSPPTSPQQQAATPSASPSSSSLGHAMLRHASIVSRRWSHDGAGRRSSS